MKLIGSAPAVAALCVIVPCTAFAADLGPITKAPPAPVAYRWSGCHAGIEGGGAWGSSQHIHEDPAQPVGFGLPLTNEFGVSGALVGVTLGCDYQVNRWVIGLENDISWTNLKGSANLIPPLLPPSNLFETSQKWLDTQRVRVGYAFDRWLVYGTGGVAFTEVRIDLTSFLFGTHGSSSQTVLGWTAGVGAEYAFWQNWSAKVEYLHADFGRTFFAEIPVAGGAFLARDVKLTNDIVRAGVNARFDWFIH